MKRVLLVAVSLVLALGVVAAPAAAVPVTDLTVLADYFPADTAIFFSMRTNDAFIDELDSLVETLRDALPRGAVPPFTLRDALDEGMAEFGEDATFENTIRTWLGDTMAVGVLTLEDAMMGMNDQPPMLIAIEISDRAAAEQFVVQSYESNGGEVETETDGDYTLLTPESPSNAFFALGDDVLLLATERDLLPLNSDFRSLADNTDFSDSVGSLPASDYHAIFALDLQDIMSQAYAMMQSQAEMMGPSAEMFTALGPLYENYPRQTLGLTMLDERSLAIDFIQSPFDYAALADTFMGDVSALLDTPAVDLDFAAHVPADAPFALQGTGFGNSVTYGIDVMAAVMEMGVRQGMMSDSRMGSRADDVPAMIEEMDANDVRAFVDLAFAGMTGLNLEEDVLPHLNGNAAMFGRVLPSEATEFTFDAALVFEVTDAAAMQAIMDQLVDAMTRYEADFTYEDGVLVLPGVIRGLFPQRFQEDLDAEATFDFLIGLNDEVFAVGSREAVEFVLSGEGDSLADAPAFADARAHFLEGSQQVGYLGFSPVRDLVEQVLATMGGPGNDSSVGAVLSVLDALSSASYSTRINEDGGAVGRMVLTLAG